VIAGEKKCNLNQLGLVSNSIQLRKKIDAVMKMPAWSFLFLRCDRDTRMGLHSFVLVVPGLKCKINCWTLAGHTARGSESNEAVSADS
jgi:hypothetical protein